MKIWQHFKQHYLISFWNPTLAVIAAGILSTYYFGLTGTYWAVTGEFTRWGGHILQTFGVDLSSWGYFQLIGMQGSIFTRIDGVMILGMFTGCLAAALWANNIKWRMPKNRIRIIQALLGGAIAGFGARLAMGCNLASFFTGIPQFSLHAWLFTLTTAIGTYFGAKFTLLPLFRSKVVLQAYQQETRIIDEKRKNRRFWLGMLLFFAFITTALYVLSFNSKLGFAMLAGVGFGLLIERAQICFTSAFRDLWLTGRGLMLKAIIYGMLISTIGIFSYLQLGMTPKIMWAAPSALIGGLLFGFGIVLAGGCETGWMYRALEGQVHFVWVGIGNIIGSTALAAVWDDIAPHLVFNFPKINLLTWAGTHGGLLINYALMGLFLIGVIWWEYRSLNRRRTQLNRT
ncbi:selenium metabolism membrane protein YedE/FdhT [Spirabiliibacterium falconis]|uniref:selenium metabolism membrane protein YedE/FdhT n=1 Tax=Spirabiliibacterium falconis TaxID=572023 RepID=UPI001AAD77D0|nr:selenium metabolism membrane protein YedE/FdhT [Spirabiliibacterium falconis]MBE2894401.1 selenium metabolism membrane protein YedE/FdhT [Spirabiliibacterium falconis]